MERCTLCGEEAELEISHVVPRFVGKRLKEDSPKPFLRNTQAPNRRLQDVPKERLLCRNCEERFSQFEDPFSRDIFTPTMEGEQLDDVVVTREHRNFCASVSWRTLVMTLRQCGSEQVTDYSDQDWLAMERREEELRTFLLDRNPHPSDLAHHLFACRSTAETEQAGLNALLNLTAGIWIRGDDEAPERLYGLAFMNGLILVTLLRSTSEMEDEWAAASTRFEAGFLWRNHHQHICDGYFGRMLKQMAQQTEDEMATMSDAQRKVIRDSFAGVDYKRWAESAHGKAVLQDYLNKKSKGNTD